MPDSKKSDTETTKPKLYWDYGPEAEGAMLDVVLVECEYNREAQAKLDKPTNLTEIGF